MHWEDGHHGNRSKEATRELCFTWTALATNPFLELHGFVEAGRHAISTIKCQISCCSKHSSKLQCWACKWNQALSSRLPSLCVPSAVLSSFFTFCSVLPCCTEVRKFRRTLIDWQRVSNHKMKWHAKDCTSSASISDYDWSMALTMTDCCPWAGDDSMSSRLQAQQVTQCSAWRTRSCIAQEVPQTATAKNLFVFIFIHHFLRVSNVDIRKARGLEVQWKSSRMSVDQCRTFWQHMTTSGSQANPLHNGHWNSEILAGRREQPLGTKSKSLWAAIERNDLCYWYNFVRQLYF